MDTQLAQKIRGLQEVGARMRDREPACFILEAQHIKELHEQGKEAHLAGL